MANGFTLLPIVPRGRLLNPAEVIAALQKAVVDVQAEGVRLMATYPPQLPNSHYRRTGTLKRSWNLRPVQVTGTQILGEIGSQGEIAPYNERVEGTSQDPFFAVRGWPAAPALVKLVEKQLPLRAQAEIDRVAQQGGK